MNISKAGHGQALTTANSPQRQQEHKDNTNGNRLCFHLRCVLCAFVVSCFSGRLIAPAAATTAIAAPAATPAASAAAAFSSRPSLVDGESAALHVFAVQGRDGRLSFLVGLHFHEAKSFGTPR